MGALDEAFRDVAEVLVDSLVDNTSTFKRTVSTYNPESGDELKRTTELAIKTSPPFPFNRRFVDGQNVLADDLSLLVPAKPLEEAEFDPQLSKDVQISVTISGKTYKVLRTTKFQSGDQTALWEMQLRR